MRNASVSNPGSRRTKEERQSFGKLRVKVKRQKVKEMSDQTFSTGTKMGTAGGTLMIILANITTGDIVKTIVLAALGAAVSFGVSVLLKRLVKWWKRTPPKSP